MVSVSSEDDDDDDDDLMLVEAAAATELEMEASGKSVKFRVVLSESQICDCYVNSSTHLFLVCSSQHPLPCRHRVQLPDGRPLLLPPLHLLPSLHLSGWLLHRLRFVL